VSEVEVLITLLPISIPKLHFCSQ